MDEPIETKIKDLLLFPRNIIGDNRGAVFHHTRADSPEFTKFGEVYISSVAGRAIKAWKKHLRMTQNLTVPFGEVRFVLYDDREDSPTKGTLEQVTLNQKPFNLLRIPSGIWYGFSGLLDDTTSLIVNCADLTHDASEVIRLELKNSIIPYNWEEGENRKL